MAREARSAFDDHVADAEQLLTLCRMLLALREAEPRAARRIAKACGDASGHRVLTSADLVVAAKAGGVVAVEEFDAPHLRPLLRQAIVATATAVETYVAMKAATFIDEALRSEKPPARLREMSLRVADLLGADDPVRRRRPYRDLIAEHLEREASAAANKVGEILP